MSYLSKQFPLITNHSGEYIWPRGSFNKINQLFLQLHLADDDGQSPYVVGVEVRQSFDGGASFDPDSDAIASISRDESDGPGFTSFATDDAFTGDLKVAWVITGGEDNGVLTIDPAGSNNSLDFTGASVAGGTEDNKISIEYVNTGTDTLSVAVVDEAITFDLANAAAIKALLTTSLTGSNNDLTFKAREFGTSGNSIHMVYLNDVAYSVTGVSVSGTTITVALRSAVADASLTTALAGANNDLVYTAKAHGAAGNAVHIVYVVAGTNTALSVGVVGSVITVNVATNGGGSATSTATLVKAAVEASTPAAALVTVALAGADTGAGVVTALSDTALAGGNDKSIVATGTEVLTAISRTPAAMALISADLAAANDGSGIVTALSSTALATGAAAAVSTTADDIKAALLASTPAAALVTAADHAGNDGSGAVTVMPAAFLSNGVTDFTFSVDVSGKGV